MLRTRPAFINLRFHHARQDRLNLRAAGAKLGFLQKLAKSPNVVDGGH